MRFTEAKLEQAIPELMGEAEYEHVIGDLQQTNPGLSYDHYC